MHAVPSPMLWGQAEYSPSASAEPGSPGRPTFWEGLPLRVPAGGGRGRGVPLLPLTLSSLPLLGSAVTSRGSRFSCSLPPPHLPAQPAGSPGAPARSRSPSCRDRKPEGRGRGDGSRDQALEGGGIVDPTLCGSLSADRDLPGPPRERTTVLAESPIWGGINLKIKMVG